MKVMETHKVLEEAMKNIMKKFEKTVKGVEKGIKGNWMQCYDCYDFRH